MRILIFVIFLLLAHFNTVNAQIIYPGKLPGKAIILHHAQKYILENNTVKLIFRFNKNKLYPVSFTDKANHHTVDLSSRNWFDLQLMNGQSISDKDFVVEQKPSVQALLPQKEAAEYAGRLKGKSIAATLVNPDFGLKIEWKAWLTNNANYIRQQWKFLVKDSLSVVKCNMLEIPSGSVVQKGTVDGSPLVLKQMFFALEHPMAKDSINSEKATAYLPLLNGLQKSNPLTLTTVMGATPKNQLRRGFLYYLERERAHPYRPYLHYNSWYDLSWVDRKMEDSSCLDRIRMYGDSLVEKRDVSMKAFLFDDGWDDNSTLWEVRKKGFPDGFKHEQKLAAKYNTHIGLWLSPWGGYGSSQAQRLKYGRMQNPPFETNANGFSMAGSVYFNRFKGVTTHFIKEYGVSIFKFDGVGAGNGASGAGLKYQADIDALLRLTKDLREVEPDIYLSLTVGTWPSPYWLYYGDAIWRAGSDFGYAGSGNNRQKWITYRDAESYKNVVKRAPLFQLNSVMLHGVNISEVGYPKQLENDFEDIRDGIWDFFASGTSLQELYINPHLLTTPMWNTLAKAAKWANKNKDVLQDVHWIGGDPAKGEIYGYASWNPEKGIFSLRNPSSETKTFNLNLKDIFELPGNAPFTYVLKQVINPSKLAEIKVVSDEIVQFTLRPYQVKIWEAIPKK